MSQAERQERTAVTGTDDIPPGDRATQLDGGVSLLRHDLRNALLPLQLHLDLLDLHALGTAPAAAASPEELRATIQRLANGLLMRNTDNVAHGAPVALHLADWWMQFGDLVRAPLRAPQRFHALISAGLPAVAAHPAVLAQIVLHVLVDARLAQRDTPRLVRMRARRTTQGVTLSIGDSGGRLSVPRPRIGGHTLPHWGMSLANSLLAPGGGKLTGHTSPEHGTHVVLRLRAAGPRRSGIHVVEPSARDWHEPPDVALRTDGVRSSAEPLRILIIDDNAALTTALTLRLELEGGFACIPPLHALRDALDHIATHAPAIVLLDLNLPGPERPLELIRAIRATHRMTRVVILTGNPSRAAVEATREAGAAGFIAKGVPTERLLAGLQRVGHEPFVLELDG